MYVCIDATGRATAWNYDGSLPSEVPQGSTAVEVTEAQFLPLRTLRAPVILSNGQFVPATAPAGHFMKALIELGWYDAIDLAVNSLTGQQGKIAKALWSRAVEFPRTDPLVSQIASAVGMTGADVDAVYILANSYN